MADAPITQLTISENSINFIITEEVGSVDQYNEQYQTPTWPGDDSGVTIGIGYDLGYNSQEQITADWGDLVSPDDLAQLVSAAGMKGELANEQIGPLMRNVVIPYASASSVFTKRTLPQVGEQALSIYPGLDQLLPDAVGAIMSMVYNRGASLDDPRRVEMANIVPLVVAKDYAGIAAQIDASKRIWEGGDENGLVTRREAEAAMVAGAVREYMPNELVNIQLC